MPIPVELDRSLSNEVAPSAEERRSGAPRILFLSPQPFMIPRGSPYRVRSTLQGLVAMGFQVDIICYPIGTTINIPGVRIIRALRTCWVKSVPTGPSLSKIFFDIGLVLSAIKALATRRYDVIHGIEEAGILAAIFGRITKTPYIFDMHSCMSRQLSDLPFPGAALAAKIMAGIESVCLRGASGVVTVSPELSRNAVAMGASPAHTQAINDVPLAIDTSQPAGPILQALIERDRKVILYTGNFDPWQGLPLLLESFAALKNRLLQKKEPLPLLLIIGGGDADSQRAAELKALTRALALTDDVHFLGPRKQEELGQYFGAASLLVSPRTLGNNPPLKIYTYLASRKPIVATTMSAHTQVLSDSTAFLADPNPEAFSSALEAALCAAPATIANMTEAGASLIEREYSQNEFQKRLQAIYQALVPERDLIIEKRELHAVE